MEWIKGYFASNAKWLTASGVALIGFLSLQLLKASNLFEPGATDVPIWAWTPLLVTAVAALFAAIFIFLSKSRTARIMKVVAVLFFLGLLLKNTLGFVVLG